MSLSDLSEDSFIFGHFDGYFVFCESDGYLVLQAEARVGSGAEGHHRALRLRTVGAQRDLQAD